MICTALNALIKFFQWAQRVQSKLTPENTSEQFANFVESEVFIRRFVRACVPTVDFVRYCLFWACCVRFFIASVLVRLRKLHGSMWNMECSIWRLPRRHRMSDKENIFDSRYFSDSSMMVNSSGNWTQPDMENCEGFAILKIFSAIGQFIQGENISKPWMRWDWLNHQKSAEL